MLSQTPTSAIHHRPLVASHSLSLHRGCLFTLQRRYQVYSDDLGQHGNADNMIICTEKESVG